MILVIKELKYCFFACDNTDDSRATADSHQKCFLPRVEIANYNIEIDERNSCDQPINNQETNYLIKQYDELRKVSTGQGDGYNTASSLDFAYFKKEYRLIASDLCKQKALDADSRAIQQIIFTGTVRMAAITYNILERSKEQRYSSLKEQQKFCN